MPCPCGWVLKDNKKQLGRLFRWEYGCVHQSKQFWHQSTTVNQAANNLFYLKMKCVLWGQSDYFISASSSNLTFSPCTVSIQINQTAFCSPFMANMMEKKGNDKISRLSKCMAQPLMRSWLITSLMMLLNAGITNTTHLALYNCICKCLWFQWRRMLRECNSFLLLHPPIWWRED